MNGPPPSCLSLLLLCFCWPVLGAIQDASAQDPKALADAGRWAEAEKVIASIESRRPLTGEELDLGVEASKRLNHWERVVSLLLGRQDSTGLTVPQRVDLSEAHLRAGDPKAAEAVLLGLVSELPHNEALHHQLVFLHLSQGRYEEAASVYTRLLERSPRAVESLVNLALIEFRLAQTASALGHLGRAFESDYQKANEFFYRQLVRNMPPEGLFELAQDTKKALGLPPDGPQAHRFLGAEYENLARYQNAIRSYEAYLAHFSDDNVRYRLARLYFLSGRVEDSDRLVQDLIAGGGPKAGPARLLGAELAVRSNHFQRAAELLAGLPEAQRQNAAYSYVAGRVALDAGRFPQAERHLSEALQRDPERAEAYYHLGQLYLRAGDVEKGRKMLQEFKNRQP